jgi:hypothetical protein
MGEEEVNENKPELELEPTLKIQYKGNSGPF